MANLYPINSLLDAAAWLSQELNEEWTERRIIVEGTLGNITLLASIPGWIAPGKGELAWRDSNGNERPTISDGLAAISEAKLRDLLNRGSVSLAFMSNGETQRDVRASLPADSPTINESHLRVLSEELHDFLQAQQPESAVGITHESETAGPEKAKEMSRLVKPREAKPATQREIESAFPIRGGWGDKLKKAPSGKYKWLSETWVHVGSQKPGDATTYNPAAIAIALVASSKLSLTICDNAIKRHFPAWMSEWETKSELLRN